MAKRQSPESKELLDTFRMVAELKRSYPAESIRQYVISGAESEQDVITVVRLAKQAECRWRALRMIRA